MSTDAYLRSVELKLRTWVFFCAKAEVDDGAEADGSDPLSSSVLGVFLDIGRDGMVKWLLEFNSHHRNYPWLIKILESMRKVLKILKLYWNGVVGYVKGVLW
nr:hypothetical protein CFP56_16177 [Quercus suber]